MIYLEVNGAQYPASITGRLNDKDWDGRASKAIKIEMSYFDAIKLFVDNLNWNIVQETEELVERIDEESGDTIVETIVNREIYDNSEYSIAGDIIDHRNGYVTVKMGKMTVELQKAQLEQEVEQLKTQNTEYETALAEIEEALGVNG